MVAQVSIDPPELQRRQLNTILASLQNRLDAYDALIRTGTGSPAGVVSAPVGTLYLRTDGGAGSTFYVKESGTGNTGWAAK